MQPGNRSYREMCVCVCVCVCEWERERERDQFDTSKAAHAERSDHVDIF